MQLTNKKKVWLTKLLPADWTGMIELGAADFANDMSIGATLIDRTRVWNCETDGTLQDVLQ